MINLEGKTALVTGGSRGIGKAIALKLAGLGCNVVFTYWAPGDALEQEKALANQVEDQAKAEGFSVTGFIANAAVSDDAVKSIDFTLDKYGALDILVNNAGITRDNLLMRMSEEEWDSVLNINLKSVFNYTKAAVRPMMKKRAGRIINIASVVGHIGNPGQANYVASKAGIIGFTKAVSKEVASRNITVNAIAPGFIQTDMTDKLNDKQREAILNMVPLQKIGSPDDIASSVAFLASDGAGYITGHILHVNGGMAT
jgi:3-oxoacyl-[acyl-carrier protein] reductase